MPGRHTAGAAAYDAVVPAPFGVMGLRIQAGRLTGIDFLPADTPLQPACADPARRVAQQIEAYFRDPARDFDLPIRLDGTPYRQRVWQAIRAIPAGRTRAYGDLAADLASAPRAIGQAVGDNPIPIVVPCHRVVGRKGLGGFAHASNGYTLDIKRWLLRHEGVLPA